MNGGVLIVIEGIDGSGKTTQVNKLAVNLRSLGENVVVSKEPTNGQHGQVIRDSARTGRLPLAQEIKLLLLDRKEHLKEKILPALATGQTVILDRYFYSNIAYQGVRGADVAELEQRNREFVTLPDIVYVLDVDPSVSIARINARNDIPNAFENIEDLREIRKIFKQLCENSAELVEIDGMAAMDEIEQQLLNHTVEKIFEKRKNNGSDAPIKPSVA